MEFAGTMARFVITIGEDGQPAASKGNEIKRYRRRCGEESKVSERDVCWAAAR